jgi:hypothetical protein
MALAKKPPPAKRHESLIAHVSATSLTIEEDSGAKTFAITPFTEVMVNDQEPT